MGCPAEVFIGDNLVFSICTHDPDTGILTDADALPSYRVYEDENATPVLTGTMDKLDDANTVGFYSEQIECTALNGFENGKSYTIYISATVDSDTGGISYGFKAKNPIANDVWDAVIEGSLTQRQATRLLLSVLTGKSSGGGGTELVFRDIGDTKDRLIVTVDKSGNRTAVDTRDGS